MIKDYIYLVDDPDYDIYAFCDIATAQQFVVSKLIDIPDVLSAYGEKVKGDALHNPNTVPISYTEFVNDLVIKGDMYEYGYEINTIPIMTKEDF